MTSNCGEASAFRPSRRGFLLGVSALAGAGSLAGCSSSASGGPAPADPEAVDALLPDHVPGTDYVKPAFPSVNGTPAVYTEYPKSPLPESVTETPGNGSTIHAMQPIYGGIPKADNQLFEAINDALGADLIVQFSDGGTYADKLATVMASPKDVSDWTVIPTWDQPPRFDEAIEACFEDLTPYLSGNNAEKYPNLAALRENTWKYAVFNGKLMAVPYPNINADSLLFYRQDIADELGISAPASTDELVEFAKAATDARSRQWGLGITWGTLEHIFRVPPEWRIDDGNLVHRYETDEYAAALEFNAQLFSAGLVHPDAMVETGDDVSRMMSGEVVMCGGSPLGWQQVVKTGDASVPGIHVQGVPPFAADGETPVVWTEASARMHNFFKKGTEPAKIEEMLRIANFLAAPYGTREYEVKRYGLEGIHFARDDNGVPVTNEQFVADGGTNGAYFYFGSPELSFADSSRPRLMNGIGKWFKVAADYLEEPAFFGQNIQAPAHTSGLDQQMADFRSDVCNGRRSLSELPKAIETWRASGGEDLRDYYAQYLDAEHG